jgi:hypothetical protein
MIRTVIKTALAASLVAGGFIALTAIPAAAKTITITASGASSLNCSITATVKISPSLKDDWTQTADFYTAVAALPTTVFASLTPGTTSSKAAGTCTGTVTDGTNSFTATNASPILVSAKLATDPAHPGTGENSCAALVAATGTPAEYNTSIKFTTPVGSGYKITSTTIADSSLAHQVSPPGFALSGGTISGSFAGGSSSSTDLIDPNVGDLPISALIQPAETGANAIAGTYVSLGCQPTLKIKLSKTDTTPGTPGYIGSASLKAGKGIKAIAIISGSTLDFAG